MVPIGRSTEIAIGNLKLGGNQPVQIQSMTNTDTNDVKASVDQCIRMIKEGAALVRLTTQGIKEVENLAITGVSYPALRNSVRILARFSTSFMPWVVRRTRAAPSLIIRMH